MGSFSKGKMVSFHQISKMGENIKVDICKCPINVELVKKSSNRPGHLQMPFQIHLHLCGMYVLNTKLIMFTMKSSRLGPLTI